MLLKNGYVYRNETQSFEMLDVLVENGVVAQIGEISSDGHQTVDLSGKWIVPGLIDVHTHGRAGYDFVSAPAEALHVIAADFAKHGVTSVMPAIASAPFEEMLAAADRINKYRSEKGEADLCGVHLEGRYLNVKRKGAHAEEYLSELRAEELDNSILKGCKALLKR